MLGLFNLVIKLDFKMASVSLLHLRTQLVKKTKLFFFYEFSIYLH